MKKPSSYRPGFICRLTRLQVSLFGNPGGHRNGHVTRCAECQRYFAAVTTLDLRLRRESSQDSVTFPSQLETRVLQAVARSARAEKPSRSAAGWGTGLVAAAAAVAIAAVLVMRERPPVSPEGIPPVSIAEVTELPRLDLVLPVAAALAAEDPLQHELDSVYSDARSAVRFLAVNFLPTRQADAISRPLTRDKG